MKLLNLACGAVRPQGEEWVNLDNLHAILLPHTLESNNLFQERNYVDHNIEHHNGMLPFGGSEFDGVIASHCIEHWDCRLATIVMSECQRILKPGGVLLVSVPDAAIFRKHWHEDTVENAVRIYGEPIFEGDGEYNFLGYAGFNRWHKTLLNEDSLWCYFVRAGFDAGKIHGMSDYTLGEVPYTEALKKMTPLLNRLPFSLILVGTK